MRNKSVQSILILFLFLCITIVPVIASETINTSVQDNSSVSGDVLESDPVLLADFSLNPVRGTIPLNVLFTDLSEGIPDRWYWEFGDGTNATDQHPNVTYTDAGVYDVTLTVWSGNGTDTVSESGCVLAEDVPYEDFSADFSMDETSGSAPLIVQFSDTSTGVPDAWLWDFGDGLNSTEQHPVHTYVLPGTYDVQLMALGGNDTVTVTESGCIVVLNASLDEEALTPTPTPTEESSPSVLENESVAEPIGVENVSSVTTVSAPLKAVFSSDVQQGTAPFAVHFTDNSTGTPATWFWDFGDHSTSAEQYPSHVYEQPGTYSVALLIEDDDRSDLANEYDYIIVFNESVELSENLTTVNSITNETTSEPFAEPMNESISEPSGETIPVTTDNTSESTFLELSADFTLNMSQGPAPLTVVFTDRSTGIPEGWDWDFGDGNHSVEKNPVHTFTDAKVYDVTLTITAGNTTDQVTEAGCVVVEIPQPAVTKAPTPAPTPSFTPVSLPLYDGEPDLEPVSLSSEREGAMLRDGGIVAFTVTEDDSWIQVNDLETGTRYTPSPETEVRFLLRGDQTSWDAVTITPQRISSLGFEHAALYIGDECVEQDCSIVAIDVQNYGLFSSTLSLSVPVEEDIQTYLSVDDSVVLPWYPVNASGVVLEGLYPDSVLGMNLAEGYAQFDGDVTGYQLVAPEPEATSVSEPELLPVITADTTRGEVPLSVCFNGTVTGSVVDSWEWMVDGATFATSQNCSYIFTEPGIAVVTLNCANESFGINGTATCSVATEEGVTENVTVANETVVNATVTPTSVPVEENTTVWSFEYEGDVYEVSTDAGKLAEVAFDGENVSLLVTDLALGAAADVTVDVPFVMPEGTYIYYWKEVPGRGTVPVQYDISEDGQSLTFHLQDGYVDEDGLVNGEITDPLSFSRPSHVAESTRNGKSGRLDVTDTQTGSTYDVELDTSEGTLGSLYLVNEGNLPDTGEYEYPYQLMKFTVEDVTLGSSVEMRVTYPDLANLEDDYTLKFRKFNPNTVTWESYPAVIEGNDVIFTLTDGGAGDDDGVADGVITDDSGVGVVSGGAAQIELDTSTRAALFKEGSELRFSTSASSIDRRYIVFDGDTGNPVDIGQNNEVVLVILSDQAGQIQGIEKNSYLRITQLEFSNVSHYDGSVLPANEMGTGSIALTAGKLYLNKITIINSNLTLAVPYQTSTVSTFKVDGNTVTTGDQGILLYNITKDDVFDMDVAINEITPSTNVKCGVGGYESYHLLPDIIANVTSGDAPLSVAFTDNSTGMIMARSWDFGGAGNSTDENPVFVFDNTGIYLVNLMVTGPAGETRNASETITVTQAVPVANFTANVTQGTEPLIVSFTDTSTNAPTSWSWTFGDGNSSTVQYPVHTYTMSGLYSVSLEVSNAGGSDTETKTDYIIVFSGGSQQSAGHWKFDEATGTTATDFSGNGNHGTIQGTLSHVTGIVGNGLYFDGTTTNVTVPDDATLDASAGASFMVWVKPEVPADGYQYPGFENYTQLIGKGGSADSEDDTNYEFFMRILDGDGGMAYEAEDAGFEEIDGIPVTAYGEWYHICGVMDPANDTVVTYINGVQEDSTSVSGASALVPNDNPLLMGMQNDFSDDRVIFPFKGIMDEMILYNRPVSSGEVAGIFDGYSPVAEFEANTTSGNVPFAVAFSDLSTGAVATRNWSFGDGKFSSEENPDHTYSSAGDYTVSLIVSSPAGNDTETKADYLSVGAEILVPVASFTANTTSGTAPLAIAFTDTSTNNPTSWSWSFGDGGTSSGQHPVHIFTSAGVYSVSLTATNAAGSNTSTRTNYISVSAGGGTGEVTLATSTRAALFKEGSELRFKTAATNADNRYIVFNEATNIDIGEDNEVVLVVLSDQIGQIEGETKTTQDPSLRITTLEFSNVSLYNDTVLLGTGSVALTAGNERLNRIDIVNSSLTLAVPYQTNPVSSFTVDGDTVVTGDQGILLYNITNDGIDDMDVAISESAPSANVKCAIGGYETYGLTPSFSTNVTSGQAPLAVAFTDASTGMIEDRFWDFGGLGTSTDENPGFVFDDVGTYIVNLTVTGPAGEERNASETITVTPGLNANFTANVTQGPKPLSVAFTDTSTGTPTSWSWNFGDGNTSTVQHPSHIYAGEGIYNVSLTLTNSGGSDTETKTDYITVTSEAPIASFTMDISSGLAPLTVQFNDTSSGAPTNWSWDFGDGSALFTEQNVLHTFAEPGTYVVTLSASTEVGGTTATDYVAAKSGGTSVVFLSNLPVFFVEGTGLTLSSFAPADGDKTLLFDGSSERVLSDGEYLVLMAEDQTGVVTITPETAGVLQGIHAFTFGNVSYLLDGMPIDNGNVTIGGNGAIANAALQATNLTMIIPYSASTWPIVQTNGTQVEINKPTGIVFYDLTTNGDNLLQIFNSSGQYNGRFNTSGFDFYSLDATFTADRTTGAAPMTVHFDEEVTGVSPTLNWSFGDGNYSEASEPTHVYESPGTYVVCLNVTGPAGEEISSDMTLTVYEPGVLTADFSADVRSGLTPLLVQFTSESPEAVIWNWSFDDGGSSTQQNPLYYYLDPGTFDVTLTVTDINGTSASLTQPHYITATNLPNGHWKFDEEGTGNTTAEDSSGTNNHGTIADSGTVVREDGVLGTALYFDGTTTGITVPHSGTLNATNGAAFTVWIKPEEPGSANYYSSNPTRYYMQLIGKGYDIEPTDNYEFFTYIDDSNGYDGWLTYEAQDLGLQEISGLPMDTYGEWYHLCGVIDIVNHELVAYVNGQRCENISIDASEVELLSPNSYPLTIGMQNSGASDNLFYYKGLMDELYFYNTSLSDADIEGMYHRSLPSAAFTSNVSEGYAPLAVAFTDNSTGNIQTWSWVFGDGDSSSVQNPVHTFSTAGIYTVNLTVAGPLGSDYETLQITVLDRPPVADFTGTPLTGTVPLVVNFTDSSLYNVTSWFWDFGDGNSSTVQHSSHTYNATGYYSVNLTVTGAGGTDSLLRENYVYVTAGGNLSIQSNLQEGIAPFTVQFNEGSGFAYDNYSWDFGDGTTSTQQGPAHTYQSAGIYTVSLTVGDTGSGMTWTVTETNYITTHFDIDYYADPLTGETPQLVHFYDETLGNPTSWLWNFGDLTTSAVQNPTHTYGSPGNYTINLTVSRNGFTESLAKVQYIDINDATRKANFIATPLSGDYPLAIQFNDTSIGFEKTGLGWNPTTWFWEFGDGNTSTDENPLHTYGFNGSFDVTLTVSQNQYGEFYYSDDETKINYIIVTAPLPEGPPANFTAEPMNGTAPLAVQFNDTTGGSPTIWEWVFGDEGTSTVQNPIHTYTDAGNYTVNLTVTGPLGESNVSISSLIQVSYGANFTATPTVGEAPQYVAFTDTSTGSPTAWFWEFGDGENSTVESPGHTYDLAGNFTVSLTVSGPGGTNTSVKTDYISINEVLNKADFSATPLSGVAPLTVTFTNQSLGYVNETTFAWDFGDGATSAEENPVHNYTVGGVYDINLTVTDAQGTDNELKVGYITVGYDAAFTASPTEGESPQVVYFTDQSVGVPTSWSWNFGDGSAISNDQNPSHIYTEGTYTVTLTVSGPGGSDTETKVDYLSIIHSELKADFFANNRSGLAPYLVTFEDDSVVGGFYHDPYYTWTFGDGSAASHDQNPVHNYTSAGDYTVSLTVEAAQYFGDNGTDTETKVGYIVVESADFVEIAIGVMADWPLDVQSENENLASVSMNVTSNTAWEVTAVDSADYGKIPANKGHLTRYDGSVYDNGVVLGDPLQVKSESQSSFVDLTGDEQVIRQGSNTGDYQVELQQRVTYDDAVLADGEQYRTIITFTATTV